MMMIAIKQSKKNVTDNRPKTRAKALREFMYENPANHKQQQKKPKMKLNEKWSNIEPEGNDNFTR